MPSRRKLDANRANAARSSGPVTPEGMLHCTQARITHGCRAKIAVLSNEDQPSFFALLDSFRRRFQPLDDPENLHVEQMAIAQWQLRRLCSIETALYDHQMEFNVSGNSAKIPLH